MNCGTLAASLASHPGGHSRTGSPGPGTCRAAAAALSSFLSALLLTALALLLLHLLAAAGWWLFDRLMDPMLERSRDALRQEQLLRTLKHGEQLRQQQAAERRRRRQSRRVRDLEGQLQQLVPEELAAFRRLCWAELELPAHSSWTAVRQQWRRSSLRWHPDHGGDSATWLRKQRAYDALKDLRDQPSAEGPSQPSLSAPRSRRGWPWRR